MFTLLFVFVSLVLLIPLGMAVIAVLCKQAGDGGDPEWELYQQRYD